MAIYDQAPVLLKNGVKERNGLFAYRPHELEYAICCCLGDRDMVPLKTMLFLTGNSNDGDFRIAQKTIFDRMKISEKRYYEARKKLEEMGWIHYDSKANAIYVNYNKIYADYKEYRENKVRVYNDSPIPVGIHDCPVLTDYSERLSKTEESSHDDSQSSGRQDRHNNIKNNIKNNISNKISGGAGATGVAPPQSLINQAFEYRGKREFWDEYMESLEEWVRDTLLEQGFDDSHPDYQAEYEKLAAIANRCLQVMYGRINDINEEYKEERW